MKDRPTNIRTDRQVDCKEVKLPITVASISLHIYDFGKSAIIPLSQILAISDFRIAFQSRIDSQIIIVQIILFSN